MRKINFAAAFLALWTMSVAPLVQGKEAENQARTRAQAILESLGFTGPDKAKNMGEIWARAREALPPETLSKYDTAVSLYRNDPIPQVSIQNVEGRGATEAVKLTMSLGPDTISIELPADESRGLKINGVAFTTEEILGNDPAAQDRLISIPYFRNAALKKKDELLKASIVPTSERFNAMTRLDWARYRFEVGGLLAAAEDVTNAFAVVETADLRNDESKYGNFVNLLIGDNACAARLKGPCSMAGWVSKYDENPKNNICSRDLIEKSKDPETHAKYKQAVADCGGPAKGMMPCNSNFFVNSSGKAHCVPIVKGEDDTKHATQRCFNMTKELPGAAIQGLLVKAGKKADLIDANGRATSDIAFKEIEEMLVPINNLIDASIAACKRKPRETGQITACEALQDTKTLFAVKAYAVKDPTADKGPTDFIAHETMQDVRPTEEPTTTRSVTTSPPPAGPPGSNLCFGLIKSDLVCGGVLGATGGAFIGGLIGYGLGKKAGKNKKKTKIVTVEKKVEVPGETKTVTVEKIVEKPGPTVYKDREVIKEVIKYVPEPAKRPTEYSPAATK